MVCAIQRVVQCRVQTTSDRNIALSKRIAGLARKHLRRGGGACERHQLNDIPSIQWKIQNAGILHDLANAGVPGLDQIRVRLDLNSLRDLADLKRDIRSEEHTSELQSHSFISYAVF